MKVKPLLQCHLLVTGLSPPMAAAAPRLRALESLLAFSGRRENAETDAEAWLCQTFGVARQHDWPVAPFAALGDGLAPSDEYWLRADPVHFHLLRDCLVVADAFYLRTDEAEALIASLNQHFAADGLQFFAPRADRWYLRLARQPALQTYPLAEVVGQDAKRLLPQGADAMLWHGRLNEAQMLLHDHPVNLAREQRGELPINSIWPWGGGALLKPAPSMFAAVWAEDALTLGLAQTSGGAHGLPCSAAEWLQQSPAHGAHLIVLSDLAKPVLRAHAADWCEALQTMEQRWFAPVLEALKRGSVASIHLHLAVPRQVRSFAAERSDLWKFWRRPKPWETLFDA
jgi:hypothetical protein